ncbi:unnamed protein product [Arabis nemorensis]|uniref:Uncharacterized protein n=1 Tax=Arabis nemorensis TaxID=586526 RepID=A0A565B940_9BRAS|nr:unnamed protein product [Arabis nemorensis]
MTTRTSIHNRSRSDPVLSKLLKNTNFDRLHMDQLLQKEIEQLKTLLTSRKLHPQRVSSSDEIDLLLQEDEVLVRHEMETVLRRKLFLEDCRNQDSSIPKETKKLVSEIAGLELQVMYLERYLLLLYRRFFNNKITSKLESEEKERTEDFHGSTKLIGSPNTAVLSPQKVLEDSAIFRSHSSLSHCSGYSFRMSPQAMDSSYHHSLPFSMLEKADIDAMMGHMFLKTLATHQTVCLKS